MTFRDGAVCSVEVSANFQVYPENAPRLVAAFGTYVRAVDRLSDLIESLALRELERRTLSEVRSDRSKAQQAIKSLAQGKALEIGFTLHGIELRTIMEIDLAVPRGPQAMNKVTILFLSANPPGTARLKLDEEVREIETKIRASEFRDSLEFVSKWAVVHDDLIQYLNQYKPQIVHFSGHGNGKQQIVLLGQRRKATPVGKKALVSLFRALKGDIRVVVLNACFSKSQAEAITEEIDCAIGMRRAIGDQAAILFAASFYRAIGFAHSVQGAFDQGVAALIGAGIPESRTPVLLTKKGVDARSIVLLDPPSVPSQGSTHERAAGGKETKTATEDQPSQGSVDRRILGGDREVFSLISGALQRTRLPAANIFTSAYHTANQALAFSDKGGTIADTARTRLARKLSRLETPEYGRVVLTTRAPKEEGDVLGVILFNSGDEYAGQMSQRTENGLGEYKIYQLSKEDTPNRIARYRGQVSAGKIGPYGVMDMSNLRRFAGLWQDGRPGFGYLEALDGTWPYDYYFGDMGQFRSERGNSAWMPHGKGVGISVKDRLLFLGGFNKGSPANDSDTIALDTDAFRTSGHQDIRA